MSLRYIDLPLTCASAHEANLEIADGPSIIRRTILPGGVRVLSEEMPAARSVAIGLWLPVGSRDEAPGHFGATHFLEHLLFKGTKRRSAMEIAAEFDGVGGEFNAATAKEFTAYYARVLAENLPMAVDVLADMITSATITEEDFLTERGVIVDELAMAADDGQAVAHDLHVERILAGTALARPVGGTIETVNAIPRQGVLEHYREHYRPQNLVVVAVGAVNHDQLCEMLQNALETGGWDLNPAQVPTALRTGEHQPTSAGGTVHQERDGEQSHVLVGTLGINATAKERPLMQVLTTVLGGGMSSRLFQEIREKRGLAYTTYAFDSSYCDTGVFAMYAGCNPQSVDQVLALMKDQWEELAQNGPGNDELARIRGQLRGSTALGLEDASARMFRLGRCETILGRFITVQDALEAIAEVDSGQVSDLARGLYEGVLTTTVVGPKIS